MIDCEQDLPFARQVKGLSNSRGGVYGKSKPLSPDDMARIWKLRSLLGIVAVSMDGNEAWRDDGSTERIWNLAKGEMVCRQAYGSLRVARAYLSGIWSVIMRAVRTHAMTRGHPASLV